MNYQYSTSVPETRTYFDDGFTPPGSPYSRRRLWRRKEDNHQKETVEDIELVNHSNKISTNNLHATEDYQNLVEQDAHSNNDENAVNVALPVEVQSKHKRSFIPGNRGVRTRLPKRAITKAGKRNVHVVNAPHRSMRFMKDIVTTLIDEQWRYTLLVFGLSFFVCWVGFALLWWLVASAHGDLIFDEKGRRIGDGDRPCVEGAKNFAGFLLLSIETQVSIGFGLRYPNEDCPEAIFLMVMQIISGICIEGAMVGIVYAKMIRPAKTTIDVLFSKMALVCQRDGLLCLMFRICDPRQSHIIGTEVKAYWMESRTTGEGEHIRQYHHRLELESQGKLFLIWPTTVVHVINAQSPLYDLSAKDLLENKFELVVTITGSSASTGQFTQTRTSYLPREMLWGHRFKKLIGFDETEEKFVIYGEYFNDTEQIDTPLCSARRLAEVIDEVHDELRHDEVDIYNQDFQTRMMLESPVSSSSEHAYVTASHLELENAVHDFRSQMDILVHQASNYVSSSSGESVNLNTNTRLIRSPKDTAL